MMRMNRFVLSAITSVVGPLGLAAGAAGQHQHSPPRQAPPATARADARPNGEEALKVGKKGDVNFRAETLVGEVRLKPGRYQLQHRVDGSDHFVHFTELTKDNPYWQSGGGATKAHPGEVNCRLEPTDKKVATTTVYTAREGDTVRVTKVLIQGENVAHVF